MTTTTDGITTIPGKIGTMEGISGPLASLNSPNEYSFEYRQYPLHNFNAGQNLADGHYIVFYINEQNNSQYGNKEGGPQASGPTLSTKTLSKIDQLAKRDELLKGKIDSAKTEIGEIVSRGNETIGSAISNGNFSLLRKTKRLKYAIAMYTPDTITFGQKNIYNDFSLTDMMGGIVGPAVAGFGLGADIFEKVKSGSFEVGDLTGNMAPFAAEILGGLASNKLGLGDVRSGALFSVGYALNPQMEVIYNSPTFRNFRFTFMMTPDSPKEAETIREIIKTLRYHAAPEFVKSSLGRYMIPPSEFDIEFMRGSQRNDKLPQISTCILDSIDVDYAAGGQWMTMDDGHPTMIRMTLDFKEIDTITKQRVLQGF